MITLYNEETGAALGEISEGQLEFLEAQLVEEGAEDPDYFINLDTVDLLVQRGADADLAALLKQAIGTTDGIEITWSEEE
ncbi:MAG: galactosyldiacylglycerol synthase [Chloroflexi bacterium]|nr:galactosyldiacylglycerol synthase [Chloroflexota bacterium]